MQLSIELNETYRKAIANNIKKEKEIAKEWQEEISSGLRFAAKSGLTSISWSHNKINSALKDWINLSGLYLNYAGISSVCNECMISFSDEIDANIFGSGNATEHI